MQNKRRIYSILFRLLLAGLLLGVYVFLNNYYDVLDELYRQPQRIVFEQPMADAVLQKYHIKDTIVIESVYMTGNFANWEPSDERYRMTRTAPNRWEIDLALDQGRHPYKFVVVPSSDQPLVQFAREHIWAEDKNASAFEDDNHGGINSLIIVKGTRSLRTITDVAVLGLVFGLVSFTLLALLIQLVMRLRMSLRLKLLLVFLMFIVLSNVIFVHFSRNQQQDTMKQQQKSMLKVLHSMLLGYGVDFIDPAPEDQAAMQKHLDALMEESFPQFSFQDVSSNAIVARELFYLDTQGNILANARGLSRRSFYLNRLKDEDTVTTYLQCLLRTIMESYRAGDPHSREAQYFLWESFSCEGFRRIDERPGLVRSRFRHFPYNTLVYPVYDTLKVVRAGQTGVQHAGYYVMLFWPWSYQDLLSDTIHFNLSLLVVLLCLYGLLISQVGRLILGPLHDAIRAIERVRSGDLDHALIVNTGDEIEELGRAYNYMRDGLKETDRLKRQFLANTSHELRTPINGIIGLSDAMLERDAEILSEESARHLTMIRKSAENLKKLVNNIMDFSKLSASATELNADMHSVGYVFEKVSVAVSGLFVKGEVRLEIDSAEGLQVYADLEKLQQVLINLIGNARKFTDAGLVQLGVLNEDAMLCFMVKDTGIGISEKDLEYIFEEFRQADGGSSRKYEGTGLGLAISRQIVQSHGGRIWAESEPGKGSCFYFTMPASPRDFAAKESDTELVPAIAEYKLNNEAAREQTVEVMQERPLSVGSTLPVGKGELLLAVDDNEINLEILQARLTKNNWRIETALNGAEGLEKFRTLKPDLILLDVMMPGMDGYDVCRTIRAEQTTHVPILFLTAKQLKEDKLEGIEAGGDDFITKPFDMDDLIIRIGAHLRIIRMQQMLHEREQMQQDLLVAADIQRTLQPARFPVNPLMDVFGGTRAARGIGGDYFDVIPVTDHSSIFLVADVSGKGVGAALVMVKVQTLVRSNIQKGVVEMTELFKVIDIALEVEFGGSNFLSIIMVHADFLHKEYSYVNAGHPGGLLLSKGSERIEELMPTAPLLGVPVVRMPWDKERIGYGKLESGQTFILYSDGITDASTAQRDLFGEERLYEAAVQLAGADAEIIYSAIMDKIDIFATGQAQSDDITLLVVKVK